ncbi:tyrosine-type recombinase/integrase [Kibdelosporangium philippinense]|uniref:Tyrosine-type recombinase/integrase n=1 Tax=Kibdelosporangium philippinense TaxID=211113 RepID=A0ABS8ZBS2_9PSEU|nr:tyrosine-type recombinase/integrase [Kibdelosporangium philippinense]MCE7003978.1 tyrosine-type recombinase/integrase [Kibdelosporangium philippinense]
MSGELIRPISRLIEPADPTQPGALRAILADAVETLPALPPADPNDRYTIRALTVLWLEADKTEHTRRAYFADLAAWLEWCRRTGLDPLDARRADVDGWKATITVTGKDGIPKKASSSTVARRLAAISSWYQYLEDNDVAERNPVSAVKRPKVDRQSPFPALAETETAALLDHVTSRAQRIGSEAAYRDAALLSLMFHTGLRVSGVTSARVADLAVDRGHRILWYTKKGQTRDFVPLAPPVLAALDAYLAVRGEREGELSGPLLVTAPHPRDPSKTGGRALTQRDVWLALRRYAKQAGLAAADNITPHTSRRTVATTLLANGVPIEKVQDLLSHNDIRITRGYDAARHKLDSSPVYTLAAVLSRHQQD